MFADLFLLITQQMFALSCFAGSIVKVYGEKLTWLSHVCGFSWSLAKSAVCVSGEEIMRERKSLFLLQ